MIRTFLFVVLVTLGLAMIPNRSNFPTTIIVPILTALLTKYTLGDWDRGFRWSSSDLLFWTSVLAISYITIKYVKTET
jgi:predicted membrane protein